jgi:hypothetical protein
MELLKFSSRGRKEVKECPCGKSNKDGKFVPYEGHNDCGFCHSCNETFLPKYDGSQSDRAVPQYGCPRIEPPQATYIQPQIVQKTMQCYESNNFVIFLHNYLKDAGLVNELIQRFRIGTAKGNRTVFWQVDSVGQVRTGQTIFYTPATGKRNKQTPIGWVHTDMKLSDFVLRQCFFGEHQLQIASSNKPIAIVESPKTAVIMAAIDSRYVWLASFGVAGIRQAYKWQALEGRTVHLFPDLGKYTEWQSEAQKITTANVKVSDRLEQYINELSAEQRAEHLKNGYDIADYAIQFDWYAQLKAKNNQQNMSTDDKILQTMTTSNPNITLLMQRFDLINPKTMKAFNV